MKKIRDIIEEIKRNISFSTRDGFTFLAIMLAAFYICLLLQSLIAGEMYGAMIFVLAVFVISLVTDGYLWGFCAAIISVFAVNWAFTFPYYQFNFTMYGYPITSVVMLVVGIATSTLTTRLKSQEKIKRQSERERMRSNLLRAMSHDIRTPLTSISGSISAVLDNKNNLSDNEKKELLVGAKEDSDWLCRMVENLLSITRISNSKHSEIEKTPELLEDVLSSVYAKFSKRYPNVELKINIPDEEVFVPMDAMLIEQLFLNILDNAVVHGETTDRIEISVVYEANRVKLWVVDNGKGIDSLMLQRIIDSSLQEYTNDSNKFMGIGLLVCKTIVDAHGGEFYAQNMPDGGACISFTLSLDKEEI